MKNPIKSSILFLCALISTALVVKGATWDAVADFASTNTENQVWQYGVTEVNGSGFTPFSRLRVDQIPGLTSWDDAGFEGVVIKNTTGADKRYNQCTLHQADVLNLHPANSGRKAVVRWKAPAAGTYLVDGRFQDLDYTTTDVSIIQNQNTAQPLFSDLISDSSCNATAVTKPFSLAVTLNAGDTLDFRVGRGNNDYFYDSTGLAILIRDDKGAVTNGVLWGAGLNLRANERPDNATEGEGTNAKVPQWSYGYRSVAASTALTLFTPAQHINDPSGLEGWIAPGQATLGVNTKTTPIVFNTGSGNYKPLLPEQIYLSPGSGNEFLVARWTVPASGDYRVLASWLDLDKHGGNGATAFLFKNGQEQFARAFQSTTNSTGKANLRARTLSLNAGDVLDFVVGSNGEHLFDATAFNAAIRRVPKVTITSPANRTKVTAEDASGQVVTFTVDVEHNQPIQKVYLQVDDFAGGPVDFTAPFSLAARLKPGDHRVTVQATDEDEVVAESAPIVVTILPPPPTAPQNLASKGQTKAGPSTATVQPPAYFYQSVRSGSWYDPGTWGSTNGGSSYPLRWDYANIQSGHEVFIPGGSGGIRSVEVRGLTVDGRLFGTTDPAVAERDSVDLYGTLQMEGQLDNLKLFINGPAGKFLYFGKGVIKNVDFVNQSAIRVTAAQFNGEGVTIENRGIIKAGPPPISQERLQVSLTGLTHTAGKLIIDPNTVISAPPGTRLGGAVELSPGHLIGLDGGTLIGLDGGTLIGLDGGTLIGLDGGTLIGLDGGTLIGNAGGTLVRPDGSPLIGLDGGTFLSEHGGALQKAQPSAPAPSPGNILLTGGTITGIGEIRGNVVNQGAFVSPGNSAGGIVVNGNYTQEAGGTLVLDLGGKTISPFTYDIFQVAGTANLGGNLVVKTIDGYTPASGDTVSALLYGNRTGNFASISSNAQVTLGANGAQVTTNGPNPQGPRALNISTRLQIQSGDNALFAGFIITGPAGSTKKVLIRGIGPSLAQFGVPGTMPDPLLELHGSGAPIINDNWQQAPNANEIPNGLAPNDTRESVIIATLPPGNYSAILKGAHGETGVGLAEVYDLNANSSAQLANIATRGFVQTGDNVLIGGFIVAGNQPAKVLVRAIGPSLSAFGLQGALQDTTLELHDSNGGVISNDNWREADEAAINGTTIPPSHDNEAAVLAILTPGNYTAVVRGADDTTGIAVVEAYNLQ